MVYRRVLTCLCISLALALPLIAQQTSTASASTVPSMINFSGTLTDGSKALNGTFGVTFALYAEQTGGSPLWLETQNVQATNGHYNVMLGSVTSHGLPTELFTSGQARWLGVQAQGQAEQPRVLLLSVPYALKAGDAQTIGGLPPSAFVLAAPLTSSSSTNPAQSGTGESDIPTLGGSGTTNFIPLWTPNGTTLGNSVFFQSGTGSTAKVGLGLTSPLATLDVNGMTLIRGTLEPITKGIANATKGFNSNPLDLEASSFNSSTHKASMQHFEWQSEPTGNNTSTPGATLNLLFGQDSNTPAETGLKLSNKGVFTFAPGQTFPGTGDITAVNAGTDLTGGGTSGSVTLNLDTTKVPQLATPNTFAATQTINGDMDVNGNVNVSAEVDGALGVFNGTSTEGVYGQTTGNVGVLGVSDVSRAVEGDDFANGGLALFGDELGNSGNSIGVLAQTFSPTSIAMQGLDFGGGGFGVYGYENRPDNLAANAAGVYGIDVQGSALGAGLEFGSGVWGDTTDTFGVGMLATADSGNAMAVFNNSTTNSTMYITNFEESSGSAFILDISSFFGGFCNFLANGTLSCNGALSTVVPTEANKKVQVYSVQSPENWFEDFGAGQLSRGSATIRIESTFAQTVNAADYHVFLTPKGDCKGLYVANETASGFEVREMGGGRSSVGFDYRIVAHRKGYESVRLADATEIAKVPAIKHRNGVKKPSSPVPQPPTRAMARSFNPVAKAK